MAPSKIPMGRNGEKLHLSCGLAGGNGPPKKRIKTEEESPPKNKGKAPIELDLGLSTNGRFGVDPSRRVLARSASVGGESGTGARGRHAPLERTRSDPAGKGKAPMVYSPAGRVSEGGVLARSASVGGESGTCARGRHAPPERTRSDPAGKGKAPMVYSPAGRVSDGGVGVQYLGGGGVDVQYLMESSPQGANQNSMMRGFSCPVIGSNLNGKQKLLTNGLLNMPHVTTLGSSPNHVKIEGILYRYRKAEELKIVCVCHGMFLSPAEFIKHGGGCDVEDPLKHIVVDPSPMFQV